MAVGAVASEAGGPPEARQHEPPQRGELGDIKPRLVPVPHLPDRRRLYPRAVEPFRRRSPRYVVCNFWRLHFESGVRTTWPPKIMAGCLPRRFVPLAVLPERLERTDGEVADHDVPTAPGGEDMRSFPRHHAPLYIFD